MRLTLPLVAMALLAACATTTPPAPPPPRVVTIDARWLAGSWLVQEEGEPRSLAGCASGLPIRYSLNGTYSLFEESGIWTLKGDLLTETATAASNGADPADVAIGRPFTSRLEQVGPDEMRKILQNGVTMTLLRCPAAP